jgi:hypothetical protein
MKNYIFAAGVMVLGLSSVFTSGAAHAGLSGNVNLGQTSSTSVFGASGDQLYKTVSIKENGTSRSVNAGLFQITETSSNDDYLAFCVELDDTLSLAADYSVTSSLFSSSVAGNLSSLFTTANVSSMLSDATGITAAAFQVAIWEIISDGSNLDISAGNFQVRNQNSSVNGSIATLASGFLNGLSGLGGDYDLTFLFAEESPGQDLVVFERKAITAASAPATSILIMLGLGGLFVATRKKA